MNYREYRPLNIAILSYTFYAFAYPSSNVILFLCLLRSQVYMDGAGVGAPCFQNRYKDRVGRLTRKTRNVDNKRNL